MSQVHAMSAAATMLAHELNQPLTAAANYVAGTQLILSSMEGDLAAEAMDELQDAHEQIQRAGEIIRRIRFLSNRQETQQRTAASLSEVVSKMEAFLRTIGVCNDAKISYRLDPSADRIRAEPLQLEQVLMHLLRNACEVIGSGQRIQVAVSSERRDDGFVEIRVRDNGPGISEDMLQSLSTSVGVSTIGELGLGPWISRTIVEAFGGSLWAANNPDGGSTFYFTVPVVEGAG
jgi:two-component system sensor kinase FixL